MWLPASLSLSKPLFVNEKHAIFLIFGICIALRAVPELVSYPHPIGYDVVNYYIPVVANFELHWPVVAGQFPTYVYFLHIVNLTTGLSAHTTVVAIATVVFGAFGVSLFRVARTVLKLNITQSIFLAIFAVVQVAVLRTAWDLHRDIFSLAAMMFAFSLIATYRKKEENSDDVFNWKIAAMILALSALVVTTTRLNGALFCLSLVAYSAFTKRKDVAMYAIFSVSLYSIIMLGGSFIFLASSPSSADTANTPTNSTGPIELPEISSKYTPAFYNPYNLLILFLEVNGLLAVPAIIGFLRAKKNYAVSSRHSESLILKVPVVISLVGSFSWLVFPNLAQLVADRWIILTGIFLSIFAGYGIIVWLERRLKPIHYILVACCILAGFAAIGVAYATMPYTSPLFLYAQSRANTEYFIPPTMQFNSLDIHDNDKLISAITWINKNTEKDAVIVGEKHWRGFMEMYLLDKREFRYPEDNNLEALAKVLSDKGEHTYLIKLDGGSPAKFNVMKR